MWGHLRQQLAQAWLALLLTAILAAMPMCLILMKGHPACGKSTLARCAVHWARHCGTGNSMSIKSHESETSSMRKRIIGKQFCVYAVLLFPHDRGKGARPS